MIQKLMLVALLATSFETASAMQQKQKTEQAGNNYVRAIGYKTLANALRFCVVKEGISIGRDIAGYFTSQESMMQDCQNLGPSVCSAIIFTGCAGWMILGALYGWAAAGKIVRPFDEKAEWHMQRASSEKNK